MWITRYFIYVFYLFVEKINKRVKRLQIIQLNDAIFWMLCIYHCWFIPFVVGELLSSTFQPYSILALRIGRKNTSIVLISAIVLIQYLMYFHNEKWVKLVRRCQSEKKQLRKRRAWIVISIIAVLFVSSIVHFILVVP